MHASKRLLATSTAKEQIAVLDLLRIFENWLIIPESAVERKLAFHSLYLGFREQWYVYAKLCIIVQFPHQTLSYVLIQRRPFDSAVLSCTMPDKFPKVLINHNLEKSLI